MSTIFGRELYLDNVVGALVNRWRPADTGFSLRTGCLLLIPVNLEVLGVKTSPFLRLPLIILACRSKEVNTVLILAVNHKFRIEKPRINNMGIRNELTHLERSVDHRSGLSIGNWPGCRCDMRDEVRTVI